MPAAAAEKIHDLSSFAEVLRELQAGGFDFAVIGGAAISAYAHLAETRITTVDLDLYVSAASLEELLRWAPRHGMKVLKRPRPRNIQVAFLDDGGLEVNLLTASTGLPEPDFVIRHARVFELAAAGGLEVLVADPFDLLRNKLAVRREKDLPHIAFLQSFLEEEIVEAFATEEAPRKRIAPARRYLEIRGLSALPEALGERLLPLAKTAADFRFLASQLPHPAQVERLLGPATDAELRGELESIVASRREKGG